MAAIICQSFGNLCNGMNECVGFLTYPCNISCHAVNQSLWSVLSNPFFAYITVTLAVNVPQVVWGAKSLSYSNYCSERTWLIIQSLISLAHIVASFYIAYKMKIDYDAADVLATYSVDQEQAIPSSTAAGVEPDAQNSYVNMEAPTGSDTIKKSSSSSSNPKAPPKPHFLARALAKARSGAMHPQPRTIQDNLADMQPSFAHVERTPPNSFQRMTHVVCYDVGVALYILVMVFWFFWQAVGMHHLIHNNHDGYNNKYNCQNVDHWSMISLTLAIVYMVLSCMAFGCSFFCLKL